MKNRNYFMLVFLSTLLMVSGVSGTIDTTKVGVEIGQTLKYSVISADVINLATNQGEDFPIYRNSKVVAKTGDDITMEILNITGSTIDANYTIGNGTPQNVKTKMDAIRYGFVIHNDWEYWTSQNESFRFYGEYPYAGIYYAYSQENDVNYTFISSFDVSVGLSEVNLKEIAIYEKSTGIMLEYHAIENMTRIGNGVAETKVVFTGSEKPANGSTAPFPIIVPIVGLVAVSIIYRKRRIS